MRSSKSVAVMLAIAALAVLMLGVLTARGSSPEQAQTSVLRKATMYLARTTFESDSRRGIVEAASRIMPAVPPAQVEVLISLHDLQPNVEYQVIGSRKPCSQATGSFDDIFTVDLPAEPGTDRFYEGSIDLGLTVKHMKSARLFQNGNRVNCKASTLYTFGRYP